MAEADRHLSWPDWLKCALTDGYSVEIQDRRVTTEMEAGSQVRAEFNTDECVAECALFLEPISANWLEAFERQLLAQGTVWFWFPLWVGGRLQRHLARFRTRPKLSEKSGPYSVYRFSLDIGRREGLMEDWLCQLLLIYSPFLLTRLAERIHYLTHDRCRKVTCVPENIWTADSAAWEAAL